MYFLVLTLGLSAPPANCPECQVLPVTLGQTAPTQSNWKPGPLPANTWGWGGVVPVGSNPAAGFFFADFAGDKVIAIGAGTAGGNRTLTAAEVGWFNNCLTLPQQDPAVAASPVPRQAPKSVAPVYQAPPVRTTTTATFRSETMVGGCSGGGVEGRRLFTGNHQPVRRLVGLPFRFLSRGCGG